MKVNKHEHEHEQEEEEEGKQFLIAAASST